jgi:hypothetical protein
MRSCARSSIDKRLLHAEIIAAVQWIDGRAADELNEASETDPEREHLVSVFE